MSTSEYGKLITPFTSCANAHYPVSANQARYLINNARHLVDESTQFRINWVTPVPRAVMPETPPMVYSPVWACGSSTWQRILTQIFPISMIGPKRSAGAVVDYGMPSDLFVRVAAFRESGGGTVAVRAVIQPVYADVSLDSVDSTCFAHFSGEITTTYPDWVIDGVTTGEYPPGAAGMKADNYRMIEYDGATSSDHIYRVQMRFLRLTIYAMGGTSASYDATLCGVEVREYQGIEMI